MQCDACGALLPAEARFCLSCGTRVPSVPAPDSDPLLEALTKAIGFQYRIERLLGRGGMGAVYLAHELALDRDVAIKVLPPEQAETPQARERFRREARTAARLSHPNIVPLHTFGEVSGLVYFVMGYVAGESLASRLKREGALPSEEARRIFVAMCEALDYAHRRGIVHRDIKPDNILIETGSGTPLLTDFGIAKPALAETQLTTAGQLIGTPHYMSPEQARGQGDIDARSDLYSLGVVAYEMVSGRRPFDANSALDTLTQRLTRDPKPLGSAAAGVPSDLAMAIDRCLQRNPAKRWPDAKSLREALMPSDEEADFSPPARVANTIATALLPLAVVAFAHVRLIAALNPDSGVVKKLTAVLAGAAIAMVLVSVVMAVRLRLQGLDWKSVLMKALQQPGWSRSWYPRAFRRRGDVWDLLPRRLRQYRVAKGLLLAYVWSVFIPLQLWTMWLGQLPTLRQLLLAVTCAGIALMLGLRRRAVAHVQPKLHVNAAAAAALLNTPTWRVSTWRRPPASSLLSGQSPAPPRAGRGPDEAQTTLGDRSL